MAAVAIRRGFADIAEGQVHYRTAGPAGGSAKPPLVMFHASPGSAKMLEPVIAALAADRTVYALDTLGNGDSSPPAVAEPDIAYFTGAHRRALDALGIARCDVYGTHTGACIGIELAVIAPDRVRRLILDGVSNYSDAQRDDMLANHAPAIQLDPHGGYLGWIWHFVRDGYLFWPWYKRDAAHLRKVGPPSPEALYEKTLEIVKAARTYHLSYRAALRYPKTERIPLIRVPTLIACAQSDMLIEYFGSVVKLAPSARQAVTAGVGSAEALAATVGVYRAFLDG